ncbi:hypothetical protein CY34DRAFT_109089 [Suillus luteus UH-Slu-Lm8-n1]|uniref:Uncharacterized protein n=1 Tax=Suillus luteus UH-Slu-Lm8-n1 TaxID=930992 RepID=A0A0D0A759_9AGAM|nr:hypothetical protein CY34DRAFT_109089 [Suillus luteus UH-Slu-Lm8-n1]
MSSAVLDIIELYDGVGAVIFIEHQVHSKPVFHAKTSTDVKASAVSQSGGQPSSPVLVVINGLYQNPFMMANMIKTVANDLTVDESLELANFLIPCPRTEMKGSQKGHNHNINALPLQWPPVHLQLSGCTAINILSVLTTPWMVQEVFLYLTLLRDVLAWQSCSLWTQPIGQGSFLVTDRLVQKTLSYEHIGSARQPHHVFRTVVQTFTKYRQGGLQITLSEALSDDMFEVITSSPTTGNMVFMTPGGIVAFYPILTLKEILVLNGVAKKAVQSSYVGCMKHSNSQTYQGLLYATWASEPILVPIPLWVDVTQLKHINDLEVLHWVNYLGNNKFSADMAQARKTYNMIMEPSSLGYDHGYTFFREHPVLYTPPNSLVREITVGVVKQIEVISNVLVLKHIKGSKHNIVDASPLNIGLFLSYFWSSSSWLLGLDW